MSATIVVAEDEGIIALAIQDMLEEYGYRVPAVAATATEALAAVAAYQPDLVLLDIRLAGEVDGITVAEQLRAQSDTPVVFLTAHSDPTTVARARAVQPAHFLLKPFNARELQIAVDLALSRSMSDRLLRESERRFATTLRCIGDGVIVTDASSQITYINPAASQITGWAEPEALGLALEQVLQAQVGDQQLALLVAQAMARAETLALPGAATLTRRDGAARQIADSIAPLTDEHHTIGGAVLVFQDVTEACRAAEEQQRMEHRLLETQRLESLGLLAGGIAHDFNNLITFIMGYIELARSDLAPGSESYDYLTEALSGGRQAADLVHQLLTYAGRRRAQAQPLDLHSLVIETYNLMQASIGRDTTFVLEHDTALPLVEAEPTQIRQVVLNLLTNAAEAIEGRAGTITLRTRSTSLTAADLRECVVGADAPPGPYVLVQVEDTGAGIDPQTLSKIFDPFFTTKVTGRGLGLAAVQGILRHSHGALRVESTPGRGSCFTVYLPAIQQRSVGTASAAIARPAALPDEQGHGADPPRGTVLVIDREGGVRAMATPLLEHLGYTVLVAADGQAALRLLDAGIPNLCGVMLDLGVPGLESTTIAGQIQALRPETPILLISGESAQEIAQGPHIQRQLQKPISHDELEAALRGILTLSDRSAHSDSPISIEGS